MPPSILKSKESAATDKTTPSKQLTLPRKRGIEYFGLPSVKDYDVLWQGPARTLVAVEASHEECNHEAFIVGCGGRFRQMPMSDRDRNEVGKRKMSQASGLLA